ncbi:hypothetical protein GCM10025791_17590 [Halioxenophilus aromaticivorans]|uniref:Uncharacterized protein n=1 Tax=Halioxenophilus aromaticivorans TaxID=1306992 RepID=A0AAV3U1J7_9ALTE
MREFLGLSLGLKSILALAVASSLAIAADALCAEPSSKDSHTESSTQHAPGTQIVKIEGLDYATAVRLGLPLPVLIRAKALTEKSPAKKGQF